MKEVYYETDCGKLNEKYDSLIIATGYKAIRPAITGIENLFGDSVFTLTNTCDLENIIRKSETATRCAVIGGGAIGIEAASALNRKGKFVTLVEMQIQLLKGIIDPDISILMESFLTSQGIKLRKRVLSALLKNQGGCIK